MSPKNGSARKKKWRDNKVARLRERDGDDCWLCLKTIDFDLVPDHPMSKSLDHVIPRSAGGTWADWNLRLAHRKCNTMRDRLYPGSLLGLPVADAELYESWAAARGLHACSVLRLSLLSCSHDS